jgi:hypothetical protein
VRTWKLVSLAVAALLAVAAAPAADPDPFTYQPPEADGAVWVGADPAGDWGGGGEAGLAGHALGQDLTNAWIALGDDVVEFVFQVTFLPTDTGGIPEATRYTWNLTVDGVPLELDGKWSNASRGACDPTSGQCDPADGKNPRVPDERMFVLRGLCETDSTLPLALTLCQELAVVQATFRPATGTVTVPIPTSALIPALNVEREANGLEPLDPQAPLPACTRIGPGANLFGGSISAAPSAFLTSSAMPLDTMAVTDTATVPGDC